MTCNMGNGDRIFRGIAGVAVLAAGFFLQSWWGLLGLVFLGTAVLKWCPAYLPFGFSTARKGE